jgi:hypothetical protein
MKAKDESEIIKAILEFEKDLMTEALDMVNNFGRDDEGTQRAITRWLTIDELVETLKIKIQ